jgi:hypothetical protein
MTYTYAILEVSPETFTEIATKLQTAGYHHAFDREGDRVVIDLRGIALVQQRRRPNDRDKQ